MRKYGLYGLGNAILDVLVRISAVEFDQTGFEKGTMRLVDGESQSLILSNLAGKQKTLCSGGSVANSVITYAQLGGSAAFGSLVGKDEFGKFYQEECRRYGVEFSTPPLEDKETGSCVVLVTPDAERTMRTNLGAAQFIDERVVDEELMSQSDWVFIEGYLIANPASTQKAVFRAVELAKAYNTKIAFTLSEAWVVESFFKEVSEVVRQADLVFANEEESKALAGTSTAEEAFQRLGEGDMVITLSEKGAMVRRSGREAHLDAYPCNPLDLTGAGDVFAATYLYGLTRPESAWKDPFTAGRAACYMAHGIITQMGARFEDGHVKELWNSFLNTDNLK